MKADLLDLNLYHWSVLPLYVLPALVNLSLFIYAQVFLPQNRINSSFSLFVFLLSISQLSDGMMHMSGSLETAVMWQKIAFAPWLFVTPIGVLFALSFSSQRNVRRARITAMLFTPAIILLLLAIAGMGQFEIIFREGWGWIANPQATTFNYIAYVFIAAGSVFIPFMMWRNWTKSGKDSIDRHKFLMLAIGVTIPYVGGLVSEIMLPLFFEIDDVPLVGPLLTVFSVFSFIAIRKYNMLDYSPRSQWSQILETLREGVLIADDSRKIMYTNPALANLLGYSYEEMLGREADKLILGESLRNKDHESAASDREFQMATKSGNLIWVVTTLSSCLNYNGKRIGTIWTITNIDDLKRKGLEVKRSEKRLNRAQEIAHVGHWDLNFKTGLSKWSAEACRIYGLRPDDDVHTFEEWMSFIHPDDLSLVQEEIRRGEKDHTDSDFEHRILLRDGRVKHLRSISKFEIDEQKNVIGIYGVCQDVTEIKQAQERILHTTNELETYIYKSSHDMHAPLSSILGLINVSRMEITDATSMQYLQLIENQTKKLDSLRTEFIKVLHINDTYELNQKVDLNKIIADILQNLRPSAGFSRMNIKVNVDPEQKVVTNEFLMRTILQSLIENSIRYQNYNVERSMLRIDLQETDGGTKIIIEDNGIGIDPSIHDKIFDMYYKTSNAQESSGLGLYLVKKAVEKLDGQVHVCSKLGIGTKFTLSFHQMN